MTLIANPSADNLIDAQFEITRNAAGALKTFSSKYDYPFIVKQEYRENALVVTNPYKIKAYINWVNSPLYNIAASTYFENTIATTSFSVSEISVSLSDPRKALPHVFVRIKNVPFLDPMVWRPLNSGMVIRGIHDPLRGNAQGILYNNDWAANSSPNQSAAGFYGGQILSTSASIGSSITVSIGMQVGFNILAGSTNYAEVMTTSLGEIYNIFANGPTTPTNTAQDWLFNANVSVDIYVVWIK